MARIRSLKPEAFQSETLAEVSVAAERTFLGLSTHVDDRGRIRDQPAVLNGLLWSLRPRHLPEHFENELQELAKHDAICRYQGCDGKAYLHLVKWDEHQRVDKPSRSRAPRCPQHGGEDYCGRHDGPCDPREGSRGLASPRSAETGQNADAPSDGVGRVVTDRQPNAARSEACESTGADLLFLRPQGDPREGSRGLATGSMTYDHGSKTKDLPPSAGAEGAPQTSQAIVAAYVDGATSAGLDRPTSKLRGTVARDAKRLLDKEHIPFDRLVEAAASMGACGWDNLDRQLQRDAAARARPVAVNGHHAYQNPTDPAAYEEGL